MFAELPRAFGLYHLGELVMFYLLSQRQYMRLKYTLEVNVINANKSTLHLF